MGHWAGSAANLLRAEVRSCLSSDASPSEGPNWIIDRVKLPIHALLFEVASSPPSGSSATRTQQTVIDATRKPAQPGMTVVIERGRTLNPYCFPGFSLHDELLVEASRPWRRFKRPRRKLRDSWLNSTGAEPSRRVRSPTLYCSTGIRSPTSTTPARSEPLS
jgi:hypothetical protein